MDAATLRELQKPLKQQYRDDPASARTPIEAEASFESKPVTASVQTWAEPPLVIRTSTGAVHPEYVAVKLSFGFPP